jgi:hypothetical protein
MIARNMGSDFFKWRTAFCMISISTTHGVQKANEKRTRRGAHLFSIFVFGELGHPEEADNRCRFFSKPLED